jgi:hypothetical protein
MTDDRDNPLLDAVDNLTKPIRSKVIQDGPAGTGVAGQTTATVELPPLLDQMLEAIRSSMGGTTSGASLAHESSPLDTDALFKMMKIASEIRSWCTMAKITPTGDPGENLRAWYVAKLATPMDVEHDRFHVKQMTGWAEQIKAKLDPWRERELPDACPLCGATEWWNKADGLRYTRPLIIRYKPDGPDMVQDAKGFCRACAQVWPVRALAYDIEHADTPKVG